MFIHLPGSSRGSLKQIISILMESGADVSEFFHRKITHLITSNRYLEVEKNNILTSNKLLTDPSSRGAMILAKTTKKQDNANIVDKAKKLGVNVIFLEEMNLEFLSIQKSLLDHTLVTDSTLCLKRTANDVPSVEVRELRTPFLKVVDHSECYRPLVLEMKEWPDAFTMFSQGPNVLETRVKNKKRKITFCELCEEHFNDLQKHLSSTKHKNNATDSRKWEGVDALSSKMPTVKQIIESKLKQLK